MSTSIIACLIEEVNHLKKRVTAVEACQVVQFNKSDPAFIRLVIDRFSTRKRRYKILGNRQATEISISMMLAGSPLKEVTSVLNNLEGFSITKSSVDRFWQRYKLLGLHKMGRKK